MQYGLVYYILGLYGVGIGVFHLCMLQGEGMMLGVWGVGLFGRKGPTPRQGRSNPTFLSYI